jgi:hypothetical protein
MPSIPITITGNADGAKSAFRGATDSAGQMASGVKSAAGTAKNAFRDVSIEAQSMSRAVERSSMSSGSKMRAAFAGGAAKVKNSLKSMGVSAVLGGAAATAGLGALSGKFIVAGDEAESASEKLKAMLESRGESGSAGKLEAMAQAMSKATGADGDGIVEASARMMNLGVSAERTSDIFPLLAAKARIAGKDMNAAASLFGKSFSTGNTRGLAQIGIQLSDVDKKAIKAGFELSQAAGRAELFNRVKANLDGSGISAGAGIKSSHATRGYFGNQLGDLQEGMGQGASDMRARWQGAATPLLERVNQSPGTLKALGAGLEIGTQAAPLLTATAMIGQSLPVFEKAGKLFSGITTNVGKITQIGPMALQMYQGATTGLRASGLAAAFSGNMHVAGAAKMRMAAIGSMTPLAGAAAGLAAVAAVAWSINDIKNSMKDMKLSDEDYKKKRGARGEMELAASKRVQNFGEFFTGTKRTSDSLDAQIAEQSRKNAAKFAMRRPAVKVAQDGYARRSTGGGTSRVVVDVRHPQSPVERAAGMF